MKTGPIFKVPTEIYVDDRLLTISELRIAIQDNDMGILLPLIEQITREASEKKEDSLTFAFLVVVIRPIIKEAISREFATYREEFDFADFFSGALAAIWIKLPFYDPTKSKLSTYIYRQTRDGNRSFTRNSEKFYEACKKFNADPALIAEHMSAIFVKETGEIAYEDSGLLEIEENDAEKFRFEAIDRMWKNLDERTAKILKLHFIDELSPKEVAEILGPPITEKTVYEYISRALNKARKTVEKDINEKRG
jgi:RNA polymerase sigma factor (sigma-70 family)